MDYEHFDVTLIGNGAKEEESSEKLDSLPKEIRVLYWKRSYPATDKEYVCHKKFMKSKKTEVPEMLLDFYRRELRRMIGMSKFDYALVFTDMKKFFPAMSGALDVKQIFNIENWQNLLKCYSFIKASQTDQNLIGKRRKTVYFKRYVRQSGRYWARLLF